MLEPILPSRLTMALPVNPLLPNTVTDSPVAEERPPVKVRSGEVCLTLAKRPSIGTVTSSRAEEAMPFAPATGGSRAEARKNIPSDSSFENESREKKHDYFFLFEKKTGEKKSEDMRKIYFQIQRAASYSIVANEW